MGALKSDKIQPEKLSQMTSKERHDFFSKLVGEEHATTTNSLFESKLLLKNQKYAMTEWAKKVAGLKPELKKDLLTKINSLDRVLDPQDKQRFMSDLASTKLGMNVTQTEAKTIADLAKKAEGLRSGSDRMAYGRATVALSNYVNDLKRSAEKVSLGEALKHPGKLTTFVAGNAKAINASLDNSAIFRQGWKTLWTNPGIWQKNARQSFKDLVRQFGGKPVMDEVNADIVSRPTYDKMVKAKLAVGILEEAFPTTAPEKIPLLGRAYKASEAAYTAFVHRTRADVFDKMLQVAEKSGVDTTDKTQLEAIGKLVNSLTGRGHLGRLEPVANTVNNVFFSPRFLKSNIDTLTAHQFQKGVTPFVRKQAAVNLVKVITGTAAIMTVANALRPGSAELDPRSSDFGKIKVGDTRFDVTGGMGSIMTLAGRLASQNSKSSTTGQLTKLNSGAYGAQTEADVVINFFENKLSPAASVVKDILKGQSSQGGKVTLGGEVQNLVSPMGVQNYLQMKNDPHSANALLTVIVDGLGISANTYGTSPSDWTQNPGKEVTAFKQAVGDTKFKQANNDYNKRVNDYVSRITQDSRYKNLPSDQQKTLITEEKAKVQKQVLKDNGFIYKVKRGSNKNLKSLL